MSLHLFFMLITGQFDNKQGHRIKVEILTGSDKTKTVEVGDDIFFAADTPVTIESQLNDTFDVLLSKTASINLQCRNYIPDFYGLNARDGVVNIWRDNTLIFAGYIDPRAFSQPYNELYDDVQLNAIDALSALQYSNFGDAGTLGRSWATLKAKATNKTFMQVINDAFEDISSNLLIDGGDIHLWYDGTKAKTSAGGYDILSDLTVSELLFLGSEEDDVWTKDQVVEAIFKYLDLHVVQYGADFYVFNWDSLRSAGSVTWTDLLNPTNTKTTNKATVEVTNDIATDTDTQLEVGDSYNKLKLTCNVEDMEELVTNPMDSETLSSPWRAKQHFMDEMWGEGEGEHAHRIFKNFVLGTEQQDGDKDGKYVWHYMQMKKSSSWVTPLKTSGADQSKDITESMIEGRQDAVLAQMAKSGYVGACVCTFGSISRTADKYSNTDPEPKLDMTPYMVIAVNGNGVDTDTTDTGEFPSEAALQAVMPVATYTGNNAGGTLSPSDAGTNNYIVISGSLALQPLIKQSGYYYHTNNNEEEFRGEDIGWAGWSGQYKEYIGAAQTVPSRGNSDGRIYTRKYYTAATPTSKPVADTSVNDGFYPFDSETCPQKFEFKYSAVGTSKDTISKIGIIQCMLIVGDQCVKELLPGESYTDENGKTISYTGNGEVNQCHWVPYKTLAQCQAENSDGDAALDAYYSQSFSIGFNPEKGDHIIGHQYDIQNNISYTMGIDADGMAIRIPYSANVHGKVQFMILGPNNLMWDEVTRRHPTMFRHTKWSSTSHLILPNVKAIFIKELNVKIYSDNGTLETDEDKDLVYASATDEEFFNVKDDIEFDIHSGLSTDECFQLSMPNKVSLSMALNTSDGSPVLSLYNKVSGDMEKPEKTYVDAYYQEYHKPRVEITQHMLMKAYTFGDLFKIPAIGKTFFPESVGYDLMEDSAEVKMKETF